MNNFLTIVILSSKARCQVIHDLKFFYFKMAPVFLSLIILASFLSSLPQTSMDRFDRTTSLLSSSELQLLKQAIKDAPIQRDTNTERTRSFLAATKETEISSESSEILSEIKEKAPENTLDRIENSSRSEIIDSPPLLSPYRTTSPQKLSPMKPLLKQGTNDKKDETVVMEDTDFTDEEIDEDGYCDATLERIDVEEIDDSPYRDSHETDYNLWEDYGVPKKASVKIKLQKEAEFRKRRLLWKSKPRLSSQSRYQTEDSMLLFFKL